MHQMMDQVFANNERKDSEGNAVRLNALEMQVFTGKVCEGLYRLVDQICHRLENYLRPPEWAARLKAAVQKNARAYDSVVETERSFA